MKRDRMIAKLRWLSGGAVVLLLAACDGGGFY